MPDTPERCYSVRDMARLLKVGKSKVLAMIHAGRLPALDVSTTPRRPQYRILPAALSALAVSPPVEAAPRRRKKVVKDYFLD